jgi:glycosyltransferase involved in cell wall biosynthesis
MFSIVIPTWNNLEYLKLCIDSIRKYSIHEHEILVHVNDGSDGTLEWVRAEKLAHSRSRDNIGVCLATNWLAGKASRDWLVYMNDDMVCCPGWDEGLVKAVQETPTRLAMFFSTLIEPVDTGNPLVVVKDFGRGPADFDEQALLAGYATPTGSDLYGQGAQPTLVHRMWWHMVGGYSPEFGPGMSSDDDLLMKFWVAGCRNFRIVDASRVYHFACRSTQRVRRNRGGRTFVMKWGITQQEFKNKFLARATSAGEDVDGGAAFPHSTPLGCMRRIAYAWADYPLGDLSRWDRVPGRYVVLDEDRD